MSRVQVVLRSLCAEFEDPANWGKDGAQKFRPDWTVYSARNFFATVLPQKDKVRLLEVTGSVVQMFGHSNLIAFNNDPKTRHCDVVEYLECCLLAAEGASA